MKWKVVFGVGLLLLTVGACGRHLPVSMTIVNETSNDLKGLYVEVQGVNLDIGTLEVASETEKVIVGSRIQALSAHWTDGRGDHHQEEVETIKAVEKGMFEEWRLVITPEHQLRLDREVFTGEVPEES